MRTLGMLAAFIVSILVLLFLIDLYDSHFNRQPVATAVSKVDADYLRSMKALCETYRKWQALPEVEHDYTGMDEICTKIEKGQP
jgi:hypothetical protein